MGQRFPHADRSAAIAYRSVGGIPIICCAQRYALGVLAQPSICILAEPDSPQRRAASAAARET